MNRSTLKRRKLLQLLGNGAHAIGSLGKAAPLAPWLGDATQR